MGQLFHYMIAWTCEHAGIESQSMSLARYGVSARKAKSAKNELFESNNGADSASGKPSVVMQRHKRATYIRAATCCPSSLLAALRRDRHHRRNGDSANL